MAEIYDIVDKNDNTIGEATREECHKNPKLIHRVVIIFLFDEKGRVLIQKRSMKKDLFPGWYTSSASGHVEKGETYKDAAKEELSEELGINVPLKFEFKDLIKSEYESEMTAYFTGKIKSNTKIKIQKEEIAGVEFIDVHTVYEEIKKGIKKITPCTKRGFIKYYKKNLRDKNESQRNS